MREFGGFIATCYNDHAVKVSDSTSVSTKLSSSTLQLQQLQSVYRSDQFTIRITWSSSSGAVFSVQIDDHPPVVARKSKGSLRYTPQLTVEWDLTNAAYASLQPLRSFYLLVLAGDLPVLHLGDYHSGPSTATLVARREKVLGNIYSSSSGVGYSTRTKFRDAGREHEVSLRCSPSEGLSVCVDAKKVVEVRRLRWNFRGNQTIFVDGLPVDLMWDLHSTLFSSTGDTVFMFRSRTGLDSRLWLEDDQQQYNDVGKLSSTNGFSLLIHLHNNDRYNSLSSSSTSSSFDN